MGQKEEWEVFVINSHLFIMGKDDKADSVLIKTLPWASLSVPSWQPFLINDVTLAIWGLTLDYYSPLLSSIRAQ